MTLSRETKIGLAVAGSFMCLVGAIVAAQLRRAPEASNESTPAVRPKAAAAGEKAPAPEPLRAQPNTASQPSTTTAGHNSNAGVFGSIVLNEKNPNLPRMADVVNNSDNMKQLQGEYRRFWNTAAASRTTTIRLPGIRTENVELPKSEAPAPRVTSPLGSTQNPWDISQAMPVEMRGFGITW